ncbi:MAG TPA: hypothetical protein VFY34_16815 [Pyrinomonadaceae bacterium]|nr:hypothetical protein [Pyrinomonadaceae bacterium]
MRRTPTTIAFLIGILELVHGVPAQSTTPTVNLAFEIHTDQKFRASVRRG